LVAPLVSDVGALDLGTSVDFLGVPVEVGMCLMGFVDAGGRTLARIGTSATGPGSAAAVPGAPVMPSTLPVAGSDALYIDPGLVSQLLFAAWKGGALSIEDVASGADAGLPLTVDALALLSPPIQQLVREGALVGSTPLTVDVDATTAPLVRAPTDAERATSPELDALIEVGNLQLTIRAGTSDLFTLATHLRLGLALVPDAAGALVPTVVPAETRSSTWLVDSSLPRLPPGAGDAVAAVVDGLLADQLAPLLAGEAIDLSGLGLPLSIADVVPTAGGYLELRLGSAPVI
jgi:hypothetical protein